jgi:hypothetical protein
LKAKIHCKRSTEIFGMLLTAALFSYLALIRNGGEIDPLLLRQISHQHHITFGKPSCEEDFFIYLQA